MALQETECSYAAIRVYYWVLDVNYGIIANFSFFFPNLVMKGMNF